MQPQATHTTRTEPPLLPAGHDPLTVLLAVSPLIAILEWSLLRHTGLADRIAAHVQLSDVLHQLGLSPAITLHATGLATVVILLVWHVLTGCPWRLRLPGVAQCWIEGLIAAAPLLAAAAFLGAMQQVPLAAAIETPTSLRDAFLLATGAGLSEELLFRLIGMAACHWLLVDVFGMKSHVGDWLAVLITAAAFTMYHDPASLSAGGVVFVSAAGLYLGAVFLLRGFAVAVIAHTAYDAVVLAGQAGYQFTG